FQAAAVNLFDRVFLYWKLRNTLQLSGSAGLAAEIAARGAPGAAARAARRPPAQRRRRDLRRPTGRAWRAS
ncbi:MAG TPA: hypothetical protein VF341_05650, partial [Anaeromyxobacteraceae bacterium]